MAILYMSHVMRKPDSCIWEKDTDHLCGNSTADQCLWFRHTYSTITLLPKTLTIFCDCTAWFVLDPVRNPEDRFFRDEAHIWHMFFMTLLMCSYRFHSSPQFLNQILIIYVFRPWLQNWHILETPLLHWLDRLWEFVTEKYWNFIV